MFPKFKLHIARRVQRSVVTCASCTEGNVLRHLEQVILWQVLHQRGMHWEGHVSCGVQNRANARFGFLM